MTTPDRDTPDNRLAWNQCAVVVLLVMAIGVVVAGVLARSWLAPPLLSLTPLVAGCAALLWAPALVICALLKPQGRFRVAVLLAVVGLLASLLSCSLAGQTLILAYVSPVAGPVECEAGVPSGPRLRYTCTRETMFSTEVYILEGREGWPFVRLVDQQTINY